MLLVFLIILHVASASVNHQDVIRELRTELKQTMIEPHDFMTFYICPLIGTPELVKQANDHDLASVILDELGFGVLGVKSNSWAARYQSDPHKNVGCFSAMYLVATSDISKTQVAGMKKIIRRCCLTDSDL